MAAVVCGDQEAPAISRVLRHLRMKGQRRIHFVRESDGRRRQILGTLVELGICAHLYRVDGQRQDLARRLCLEAIVGGAVAVGASMVVLERDDSCLKRDQQTLHNARAGLRQPLRYEHLESAAQPLLWAADALAWSYAKGGDWVRRIRPIVSATRLLLP
jgi:hypothetical protein